MKSEAAEARRHLLKALAALNDPAAHCKERGYELIVPGQAMAYAAGAARASIEFALQALGEPVDPYRRDSHVPYVPADNQQSRL